MDRREFLKFTGIGVVSAFLGIVGFPKEKVEIKEPEIKTFSGFRWIHSESPALKSHIDTKFINQYRKQLLQTSKQLRSRVRYG